MIMLKSQFVQHVLAAITLAFVLGALSMIWPAIIAVFLGMLLLLQSFSTEPEIAVLSLAEIGHASIVLGTLWRSGLPAILS